MLNLIKKILLYLIIIISYQAQTNDDLKKQVDSLNNLSFKARGTNPLETIKYGEKALALGKTINYLHGQCESYSFIGVGYRNMSYFKKALESYLKGLTLADSINNKEQIAFAYNNIGNLYLRSGNDSLAQVYLQQTLDFAIENNFDAVLAYAYKNLGSLYYTKKEYSKALELLNKSLSVRERLKDNWGITNTLNELGAVRNAMGFYKTALECYDLAFENAKKIKNNKILIGEIYLGKANVYYSMGDFRNAENTITKGRRIFESINARTELVEIYDLVSNINAKTGDYKEAFLYLQKQNNLNDSIKVLSAERQLELMELLYISDKNQKENELLKRDNAIKLLQIEQEKQFRNLLILISFLSVVTAITSYMFYKGKKKSNELLVKKNELIEEQKTELSKINATKDKFFSIIAHDLKNPFGSLMNLSDLLLDEINDLTSEELQELVEAINNASKSSYRLLENLLLWSQTQKGHITFKPEIFAIANIIQDNFSLYSEMAKGKNITLKYIQENADSSVYADKNMFDAIIRNMVNNAIKYSDVNGIVKISTMMNGEKTLIKIEDNGIGIPQNKIDKLFSVEDKQLQSGTKGEKGTGLGLVVCKEFIDINGGEIKIESEVNKGTLISIYLPKSNS